LQRVERLPTVQSLIGDGQLADLPEDLQLAVFNAAFGPWMDAFAALAGLEISLKSWQRKPAIFSEDVTLGLKLTNKNAACWRGWVSLPRDMAAIVVEVLNRFPLRPATDVNDVPVPIRLDYGATDLSAADFRTLRLSDVLLVERFAGGDRQHLVLRAGDSSCWTAKVDGHQLLVEQPMHATTDAFSNALSDTGPLVDALPVRVTFDLGEQAMSMQELSALGPGFIWELASPLDRPVTVRANGKAICQGELVAIGDRIGVRLVEVVHEREHA
jgi:type III secretion protein Q